MDKALLLLGIATLVVATLTFLQGRAAERRALEARDTVWQREQIDGTWNFRHSGSTSISEVKIVLTVDGVTEQAQCEELQPNTNFPVPNREHTLALTEAVEAETEYQRQLSRYENPEPIDIGFLGAKLPQPPGIPPLPLFGVNLTTSAVITWRHPSGAPGTYQMDWRQSY